MLEKLKWWWWEKQAVGQEKWKIRNEEEIEVVEKFNYLGYLVTNIKDTEHV